MRNYRSKGIVIALKQLKEANRLAIIWSEDKGKKAYLVKGANKILSKKSSTLDQLNLIGYGAYHSRSEYDLLIETELINDFQYLKKQAPEIGFSLYLLELLDRFLPVEQPTFEFFHWICTLLEYLNSYPQLVDKYLLYFQLKILAEFGYAPLLDSCSICFQEFKPGELRILNTGNEPGFICFRHFDTTNSNNQLISDTILKVMRFLSSADLELVAKLELTNITGAQIFNIQNLWLETVSEKVFHSQELLKIWTRSEK